MKKSECECLYNVWIVLYTCMCYIYVYMYVWALCYVKEVTELPKKKSKGGYRIIVATYRERKCCWVGEQERECLLLRRRNVPTKIKSFFFSPLREKREERRGESVTKCHLSNGQEKLKLFF